MSDIHCDLRYLLYLSNSSFLDGFGFFASAPIFATMSKLVPALGWSAGWSMLAGLFGAAALLMMSSISPILNLGQTQAEKDDAALAKAP